jgi:acyl-coenzyme A thioesterase PaaI-like protein
MTPRRRSENALADAFEDGTGAPEIEAFARIWATDDPERLVGRGHPVGDLLDAHAWRVLERPPERLLVRAALNDTVRNPRGELFGGFTPTYVDFFALHVFHAWRAEGEPRRWLSTANLRVDCFLPIHGPEFDMDGCVLHKSGRTGHVEVRFLDLEGRLCALAQATLIERRS